MTDVTRLLDAAAAGDPRAAADLLPLVYDELRKLAGALLAAPDDRAADDHLALDRVLQQLELEDPSKAQLVKLRYFAGLSIQEAAAALGISPATAKRHWVYARSWLYGKLQGQ